MAFLARAPAAICKSAPSMKCGTPCVPSYRYFQSANFHTSTSAFKKQDPPRGRRGRWDEPPKAEPPKAEPPKAEAKPQAAETKAKEPATKPKFAQPNPVLPEDTVTARYAQYLWKGAEAGGDLHRIEADIIKLETMKGFLNDTFQNTANNAKMFLKQYGKVLETAKMSRTFTKFIMVVLNNKKGPKIWDMLKDFKSLLKIARQEHDVVITSAEPLTQKQFEGIRHCFTKNFPDFTFQFKQNVNPSLLGGMKITYDGELVFDNNKADKVRRISDRYSELMKEYQKKRFAEADAYLASLQP